MADKNIRHRYLYNDAYRAFTGWITDKMRIETPVDSCGVRFVYSEFTLEMSYWNRDGMCDRNFHWSLPPLHG